MHVCFHDYFTPLKIKKGNNNVCRLLDFFFFFKAMMVVQLDRCNEWWSGHKYQYANESVSMATKQTPQTDEG